MSAEVTSKKRGRPKKVVVEEVAVNVSDVPEPEVNSPAPKTQGKTTAKTPAKKPATTSTTFSSVQSKSTIATRKVVEPLQDVGFIYEVQSSAQSAAKRQVTAVKTTKSTASTRNSKGKHAVNSAEVARPRKKGVASKSEASRPGVPPSLEVEKIEPLGSPIAVALPATSSQTTTEAQEVLTTSGTPQVVDARRSRYGISRILQQAKAFSRQSGELSLELSGLVDQRQTLSIHDIEAKNPVSKGSGGTDAAHLPAEHPHLLPESTSLETSSALNIAPISTTASAQPPPQTEQPTVPPPSPEIKTSPPPPAAMPFGFKSRPTPQIRAYSSTSPLPMSTTLALAARQVRSALPLAPSGPPPPMEPRHPAPFSPPPEFGPRPPKLSELPLEQRKKDPKYRAAAYKYTAAIVALPFAIVFSWKLWERCEYLYFSVTMFRLLVFVQLDFSQESIADRRTDQQHQVYLERVRQARMEAKLAGRPDPVAPLHVPVEVSSTVQQDTR